jgi:hypothetical protein
LNLEIFVSIYCINENKILDLATHDFTNEELYLEEIENRFGELTGVRIVGLQYH